jgi:hypothetical protein
MESHFAAHPMPKYRRFVSNMRSRQVIQRKCVSALGRPAKLRLPNHYQMMNISNEIRAAGAVFPANRFRKHLGMSHDYSGLVNGRRRTISTIGLLIECGMHRVKCHPYRSSSSIYNLIGMLPVKTCIRPRFAKSLVKGVCSDAPMAPNRLSAIPDLQHGQTNSKSHKAI